MIQAGGTMGKNLNNREQLSALADGQLHVHELAQALEFAGQEEGRSTWKMYHFVGDVLRSPDLAFNGRGCDAFVERLRSRLQLEAPRTADVPIDEIARIVVPPARMPHAANEAVFRWKVFAAVTSLAAVIAVGWGTLGMPSPSGAPQLAVASEPAKPSVPTVAVTDSASAQVMMRDARLDELLAAHKQFGGTSALQMPAEFLRNASFNTPAAPPSSRR